MTVALIGYYTITPTHCGTGQAADAVDLPIARESHTQHPILPATSIKGSVRDAFELAAGKSSEIDTWFGPQLNAAAAENKGSELRAGSVIFGEGRLLAFPVRALHTAFCYVTCPLILERFARDLRAHGLEGVWRFDGSAQGAQPWDADGVEACIAPGAPLSGQPLVLEDLVILASSYAGAREVTTIAQDMAKLLPEDEKAAKKRMEKHLVVLRDEYFNDLVRRTTPVQARVRLNDKKTTTGDGGNLWYEESLPSDCLFASFVSTRRQTRTSAGETSGGGGETSGGGGETSGGAHGASGFFGELEERTWRPLQLGGNETVGQGLCLWRVREKTHGH